MSVRSKILSALIAVLLVYVVIDHVSLRFLLGESIAPREREAAEHALQLVKARLEQEKALLAERARDWAERIATLEGRDLATEFDAERLRLAGVDLLYVCQADGKVSLGLALHPATHAPLRLREFPAQAMNSSHPALAWPGNEPERQSIGETEHGLLFVASCRVGSGDAPATMIVGRFADERRVQALAGKDAGKVALRRLGALESTETADELRSLSTHLEARAGQTVVEKQPDSTYAIYALLQDWRGQPELVLELAGLPISAGLPTGLLGYVLLSGAAAALLVLFLLVLLLERIVLNPLGRLTGHVCAIRETGARSEGPVLESKDELGTLAREFHGLLERLDELRLEAADASRRAGVSQIAASVLHNVGNALNSVGVASWRARETAKNLNTSDLAELGAVLEREAGDLAGFLAQEGRALHLVGFVREFGSGMNAERDRILAELDALDESVQRISAMLVAQQQFVEANTVLEPVGIAELVDLAAARSAAEVPSNRIEFVREYEDVPQIVVDRHRLNSILMVLITNARESIAESPQSGGRVTLRIRRSAAGQACIEVEDDGLGLPPERLTTIFSGGFTTKPKRFGFSLHHAANAATELDGHLTCSSGGSGKGACFRLELNLAKARAAA